jgi:hypothetical protein
MRGLVVWLNEGPSVRDQKETAESTNMIKKLIHAALALTLAIGVGFASVQPVEARGGRTAAIVGGTILGLGLLGAYAEGRERTYYRESCYQGPPQCRWVEGPCYYNSRGDYICRRGYEKCYRPTICD